MDNSPEEPSIRNDARDPGRMVFVTGSTSPLGLRVIQRLTTEGWSPCCLLRSAKAERELFSFGATSVVRGDCREPERWIQALEGIPTLLHLAPISLAPSVFNAARNMNVSRCVAISSTRGLSRLPDRLANTVRESEEAIKAVSPNITLLRCAMIYGSGKGGNVDRLARWIDRSRWVPLVGDGSALIQPVHIDDVAAAVLRALNRPETTHGAALTVAGPSGIPWREMAETIAEVKGRKVRWVRVPHRLALTLSRVASRLSPRLTPLPEIIERLEEDRAYDISETRTRLGGWTPLDLRSGLERTYGRNV